MNIVIVGAKGQLGTELATILKQGHSELGAIPVCYKGAKVHLLDLPEIDITVYHSVLEKMQEIQPDLMINCAAYTNVNGCETDREAAFAVNAIGPRNLARAAQTLGAKLVHVSTDYVFEGTGTVPYIEWDIENPQSIYGKTKYLGEQYVRDFSSKYYIVRTAWLYGYYGNNFVKTMMKLAKDKGQMKVVNDQRGNPTNAADLAHHILKIAATQEYGMYHCTGSGECSWYDFACKIIKYAGIPCIVSPCTTEEFPTPAKRPAYSALDNMMLRSTGMDEMRRWEDALKYFVKEYMEREKLR